ncbi:MAG: hypothetical protein ACLTK0_02480 [Anaerovoracaceae bacterium]
MGVSTARALCQSLGLLAVAVPRWKASYIKRKRGRKALRTWSAL